MGKSVNWYKLNRALHRDIGYFCIGLTLVFAISGIALNHVADWNPNYQVTQESVFVDGLDKRIASDDFDTWLLDRLALETRVKARFWESPNKLKLFTTQEHTLIVQPPANTVVIEQIQPRMLLRSLNFLHLNEARRAWTYFSDLYALMLIFLSLSALFMLRGRHSVWGKRGLLVVAGFLLPALFVALYAK